MTYLTVFIDVILFVRKKKHFLLNWALNSMFICAFSCFCIRISYNFLRINDSGAASVNTKPIYLTEKKNPVPNDWDLVRLLLSLLKAHQAKVERLKHWPGRLVCRALGFFPSSISLISVCGHYKHIEPGWRGILFSSPVKWQRWSTRETKNCEY